MARTFLEQFLRDKTATQLLNVIRAEKGNEMKTDRSGADYIRSMLGLSYLFEYVRQLENSSILDCGSGTTKGINEIGQSHMGYGIVFQATVLRHLDDVVESNLGKRSTFRTPIETLSAVMNRGYGGMLALNSLAYSLTPELAIQSIDNHLIDGGALKATFIKPQYWHHLEGWNTHETYSNQLIQLGYDVAICSNGADKKVDVLLALKPGASISAETLMEKDLSSWREQFQDLRQ